MDLGLLCEALKATLSPDKAQQDYALARILEVSIQELLIGKKE